MRQMNYEKIPVNTVSDISTARLDLAAPTKIYFGERDNIQDLPEYKGIFNVSKGRMATVADKNYQIIQNDWVQKAVANTLGRLNLDVKGVIKHHDNHFVADLVFQNAGVDVRDDAQGISIGIRVVNSYDTTTGFRLEMFGFRRVCQNGMTFGAKSFGIYESTVHYGIQEKNIEEISHKTEAFIHKVIASSGKMQEYVNAMIGDSIEYENCVKIIRALVKTKKHIEPMLQELEGAKTRWDLYNVFTHYATHNLQLTPQLQTMFEAKSRKIMETSSEGLNTMAEEILAKIEVETE